MTFSIARLLVFPSSRFLLFLVAAILFIAQSVSAQVVEIPDPNLEGTIRDQLNLPADAPITQQDMLKLTRLDGREKNITDLTGLEYATNLEHLYLAVNAIENLEPLAGLMRRLQILNLSANQIMDITPLANLTNLTELKVSRNQIMDITPLANLTNLTELTVFQNQVHDLNPLTGLTRLTFLDLSDNLITDLNPLMNLTALERLRLSMNAIVDITLLANFNNLTELKFSRNQVRDITPLAGLTRLTYLDLSDNLITDLNPLMNLTALKTLRLNMNAIVDITPLSGLKNLKELGIADNPITDFSPLTELEGVELDLGVDFDQLDQLHLIVTIPDLNLERAIRETLALPDGVPLTQGQMLRLTKLTAWERGIIDLTGLQYATNLEFLSLGLNQIEDIAPLANLIKLRWLDFYVNRIQDISPLANLVNLETLFINDNLVTDFTPLLGLNLIELVYDEVCDFPPLQPPVRERMERRNFPSIFQMWDKVLGVDHLTDDQRNALHDLTTRTGLGLGWDQTPTEPTWGLASSLAGDLARARRNVQRRISHNPNIVYLGTINFHSHFSDDVYPPGSDYFLRDENGELITGRSGSPKVNFLHPEVQDLLVKRIIGIARCGLFDGVMIDQFADQGAWPHRIYGVSKEEIIRAFANIFKAVRQQVREDFLILINAGREKITRYTEYVNGSFMEIDSDYQYMSGMPGGYSHDGLKQIESTLTWLEQNLRSPQINCLEGWGIPSEPPDSPENQRWMRVITTLSLTHSDGYVMYNTGWGAVIVCEECPYQLGVGHEHIWYDFWDADLGQPVGPKAQPHQEIQGLFIREFTNGWAVYNRSGKSQTITLPASATPVSDRGNNAASLTHLLPDLDGEIYLKAKHPADVNGDGKVNILDLVHITNSFGKTSPDLNNDGVVNILDLTLVAQQFNQ